MGSRSPTERGTFEGDDVGIFQHAAEHRPQCSDVGISPHAINQRSDWPAAEAVESTNEKSLPAMRPLVKIL